MINFDNYNLPVDFPKPVGELKINEGFTIQVYKKLPNRFHRWMAKVLLGWIYADVGAERSEDAEQRKNNPQKGVTQRSDNSERLQQGDAERDSCAM